MIFIGIVTWFFMFLVSCYLYREEFGYLGPDWIFISLVAAPVTSVFAALNSTKQFFKKGK